MLLNAWLLFTATEILLALTPGPAVLFVLSYGISQGGRESLWANAGILTCSTLYFSLSALGLGAVLLASHQVFLAIQYLGAFYLAYLGLQTIRGNGLALAVHGAGPAARGSRALARGLALQAANPKALVFFTALLPQFIDTRSAVVPQIAILGATSVIIEFFVLVGYGYTAGRAAVALKRSQFVKGINMASGTMLVVAGAGLVLRAER